MDAGTIVGYLTLALVAVGLLFWRVIGSAATAAGQAQAKELVDELNKARVLARDLANVRGTERQEIRFASYGQLWARMKPLAIYDDSKIDQSAMAAMSKCLSGWYFSEKGGLMLTPHNRSLYFALQDLVSSVASQSGWKAERPLESDTAGDLKKKFVKLLDERRLTGARGLVDHLAGVKSSDWPSREIEELAESWRIDINTLARDWAQFDGEKRFVVLQQVASTLRTGLTNDIDSRLR
jgi:hypothetical protein